MSDRAVTPAPRRRDVLAGAGALVLAPSLGLASQAQRIEVHNHVVSPEHILARGRVSPGWIGWTPERIVAGMDRTGRDLSLVSYMIPDWLFVDREQARALSRACNDHAADQARDHAGRFAILAGTPSLDDAEGALAEVARTHDRLGARGAVLMTTYGERRLDHPAFAPVLEALDRRGATVFVQPSVQALGSATPASPGGRVAMQLDAAGAVANLRRGGRWSRIRFVVAHPADAAGPPVHTYWWGGLPQRATAHLLGPSSGLTA